MPSSVSVYLSSSASMMQSLTQPANPNGWDANEVGVERKDAFDRWNA